MKQTSSSITFEAFFCVALHLHEIRQKQAQATKSLDALIDNSRVAYCDVPSLLRASSRKSQTVGIEDGIKSTILLIWDEMTWEAIERAANLAPDDIESIDSAGMKKLQGEYLGLRLQALQQQ